MGQLSQEIKVADTVFRQANLLNSCPTVPLPYKIQSYMNKFLYIFNDL